ncbi:MAG: redox-sensing transcriptional repressor Rex [Clostridia bacterium]|nr:redox-sensing transcriptional repressor Rex [Clostridia bacterium]
MNQSPVAKATLSRLPIYLQFLRDPKSELGVNVSATIIAKALGLGEVQVRKDLASVSGLGKPKVGYNTADLIACLEHFLGYDQKSNAVLVGAGKMGRALLGYKQFDDFGLEIIAAFDKDNRKTGRDISNKNIYAMEDMKVFCEENDVHIGIITVPGDVAQEVADALVACGITAIWNFAPVTLTVPENVCVSQENLALSLAYLNLKNQY